MMFKCGDGNQLAEWNYGTAGTWGDFKTGMKQCPKNQAVCGMKARIDPAKHGDEAIGLSDVTLYCCDLPLSKVQKLNTSSNTLLYQQKKQTIRITYPLSDDVNNLLANTPVTEIRR